MTSTSVASRLRLTPGQATCSFASLRSASAMRMDAVSRGSSTRFHSTPHTAADMAPQQAPVMTPSFPESTAHIATLVIARMTMATRATSTKNRFPEA